MEAGEKRLNEMDRLGDMGHFPAVVNGGATVNVLGTMAATWWAAEQYPDAAPAWLAGVLAANLLPVAVLRARMDEGTTYPQLKEMDFLRDQHKFSDWVYVAASADMAFWVLLTWQAARVRRRPVVLAGLLAVAAVATFSPVLLRGLKTLGRR